MSLGATLAGKHVLLTGATGFVGKVWLSMVLDRIPDIGQISVVVRPRSRVRGAVGRFERILDTSPALRPVRDAHQRDLADWLSQRVEVLSGDIEKPLLGLGADVANGLKGRVDLVLHCAGITDFQPDPAKALRINIFGARHAAQLARKLDVPLIHVSTCFVAGMVSGDVAESLEVGVAPNGTRFDVQEEVRALAAICREGAGAEDLAVRTDLAQARAERLGWPNLYTYSKGLAEHLVAGIRGVDWTIVRPSVVECAQSYPFPGWNEGLNTAGPLAWLITTPFRRLPTRPDNHFDVVPVDEVCRGLTCVAAAALEGRAGGVWQLASSDANPLTFGRCVELTGLAKRRWTRRGHGDAFERLVVQHLDPIPVALDNQGPLAPDVLKPMVSDLRRWLKDVDARSWLPKALAEGDLGDRVEEWMQSARNRAFEAEVTLGQVEHMLALFQPFIHDHDPVFRTDRIRTLSPGDDPDWAWRVPQLDWRRYWVDIEYPGLQTWSIPAIRGEKIPADAPSEPRLRLRSSTASARAASK